MSRDYAAKRLAKEQDIPYTEALRRLLEASTVNWPDGKVQLHERIEVAGYTGPPESEDAA